VAVAAAVLCEAMYREWPFDEGLREDLKMTLPIFWIDV
jgi:hypothetical protein